MGPGALELRQELLLLRSRRGDREALGELIALWQPPLLYYLRRLTGSEEESWDVLQEVWVQLVGGVRRLADAQHLRRWLYRVARNVAVGRLRRRHSVEPLPPEQELPDSLEPEPTFTPDDALTVHAALDRLTLAHREVLVLHFLEGFGLAEIATVVEVPVGTVKSRLYHAKRALRAAMAEER